MMILRNKFPGKKILTALVILLSALSASGQTKIIDSLARRLNQVEGEEKIKTYIGLSYNFLRISPDSSLFYANRAYDYSRSTGNQRGIARSLNLMGIVRSSQGDYQNALDYHKQALDIFENIQDTNAIGLTSNNIGINYKKTGNYSEAVKYYQKASDIADKAKDNNGRYYAKNNIGIVYVDWGKYETAVEYYNQALAIANGMGKKDFVAITLNNLGETFVKLQDTVKALDHFNRSLVISKEIGAKKGIYNPLFNIGTIYYGRKDYKKARENLEQSLKISEELGDKYNIAYHCLLLGQVFRGLKKYDECSHYLDRALQTALTLGKTTTVTQEIYKALADYYSEVGRYRDAFDSHVKFTELKDTIYNRDSRLEITEMQTKYETEKKNSEILRQQFTIERQQNRLRFTIIAIALAAIAAVLLFMWYRLRQQHVRVELERKNIEIEQRLLRTQMNPHFIFNSLNSINAFISGNKPSSAQSFLTKFARLMRYILDNSRKSFVPVEDEINTLELNMELEQLRFDNKFDFEIRVDNEIDPENTYIPPMLIQPFIENAILHGLVNKEGQGHITVGMNKKGKVMQCVVEDNGIGREKAMEMKKLKGTAKHKSLGMQVTQERLALLNEKSDEEIAVRIIDLKDEQGAAKGTRVELTIPFEVE